MDHKEERFMRFWEKNKSRKWRFRIVVGLIFGLFMLLIFGIKTYFFSKMSFSSPLEYLTSKQFLIQFIFLVPICGWIYGWFMYRYCIRMEQKIRDKYHES